MPIVNTTVSSVSYIVYVRGLKTQPPFRKKNKQVLPSEVVGLFGLCGLFNSSLEDLADFANLGNFEVPPSSLEFAVQLMTQRKELQRRRLESVGVKLCPYYIRRRIVVVRSVRPFVVRGISQYDQKLISSIKFTCLSQNFVS